MYKCIEVVVSSINITSAQIVYQIYQKEQIVKVIRIERFFLFQKMEKLTGML